MKHGSGVLAEICRPGTRHVRRCRKSSVSTLPASKQPTQGPDHTPLASRPTQTRTRSKSLEADADDENWEYDEGWMSEMSRKHAMNSEDKYMLR